MPDQSTELISAFHPSNLSPDEKSEYLRRLDSIEKQQARMRDEIPRFTPDVESQNKMIAQIIAGELLNKGFDVNVSENLDKFTDKNVNELIAGFREQLSAVTPEKTESEDKLPSAEMLYTLDSVSQAKD